MILVDNELWNNFLEKLSLKFAEVTFNTWFKPLKLYKIDHDNNEIIIVVPMQVHKKMIEANWMDDMNDSIFEVTGINYDIKLVLETDYLESFIGSVARVLVETNDSNTSIGHTDNFLLFQNHQSRAFRQAGYRINQAAQPAFQNRRSEVDRICLLAPYSIP